MPLLHIPGNWRQLGIEEEIKFVIDLRGCDEPIEAYILEQTLLEDDWSLDQQVWESLRVTV